MALNLDELLTAPDPVKWVSEVHGAMLTYVFSVSALSELEKLCPKPDDMETNDYVRTLISVLCARDVPENSKDQRLSMEEVIELSGDDLETFSSSFIASNENIFEDIGFTVSGKKQSNGERVKNGLSSYVLKSIENMKDMTRKFGVGAGISDRAKMLLNANSRISDSIGRHLAEPSKILAYSNPVEETNIKLANLNEEFRAISTLVRSMNDVGIQLSTESTIASNKAKFWNGIMFFLGLVTLLATLVLSILSLNSSSTSSALLEDLLDSANETNEEQLQLLLNNNTVLENLYNGLLEMNSGQKVVIDELIFKLDEMQPARDKPIYEFKIPS